MIGFSSLVTGNHRKIFIAVGVVLLLLMVVVVVAAAVKRRSVQAALATERYQLLDKDLSPLLQLLAEAVATQDPGLRSQYCARVRQGVVAAASVIVAPAAATGTRANLFRRNGDEMILEPGCFAGRGDKSTRTFKKSHETSRQTMKNKYRFVEEVDDASLIYKTYLTYPVAATDTEIFGVLTVDCMEVGDLSKRDIPAMCVLSAIAAASYALDAASMSGTPQGAAL
ncbi:hypothetical protein CH275_17980 [Rhodococcus sp. 06-235-1A]|uniref:hypothetical protein n=1 Tax=Rhodococcus sp. 06-235-1A TaxID=2022508 RepID=UPI000B9C6E1C|nr:hypothetical protein [Rhodococcus sp. 06-235-1A]OZD01966.1 hypothetical protein CH275_17980 [Rhodococcus sp. 06-235-1A]